MKGKKSYFVFILVLLLSSCSEENLVSKTVNFFSMKDCRAPVLISIEATSASTVSLFFDEEVIPFKDSFTAQDVSSSGTSLEVDLGFELSAADSYDLKGRVKDIYGNTTSFVLKIWGFNSSPVSAVINEITTKGTDTQPDRTELLITGRGNTAGLTIWDGIPGDSRASAVLPYRELDEGDYVVVYWGHPVPEALLSSSDEHVLYVSSSSESSLSDDNGIITLSLSPAQGSSVLDCVVYSSFTSSQYEGFGTKAVYTRVQKAKEENWWAGCAVDSSRSTSTRSMCRVYSSPDNDSADTWYTTETKGQSFGKPNTAAQYEP